MATKKKTDTEGKFTGYILCNGFTAGGKNVHGFITVDKESDGLTSEELRQSFNVAHGDKENAVEEGFTVQVIEE